MLFINISNVIYKYLGKYKYFITKLFLIIIAVYLYNGHETDANTSIYYQRSAYIVDYASKIFQ